MGGDEASRPARLARRLEGGVALVSRAALVLAGLACLLTFAAVCYSVATRYFFNAPQTWVDETVGWLVAALVLLAIPEAQRRGENIGVESLIERANGGTRKALLALGSLSVIVTAGFFIDHGLQMVAFSRMIGMMSNTVAWMELWTVQMLVPVGGGLLLLVALVQLLLHLLGLKPRDQDGDQISRAIE